jgi:Zn-dependent peptidase ImmA (M78 family)
LPKFNVPSLPVAQQAHIEASAEQAREYWNLGIDGPIPSMVDVLESAGVMLTVADKSTAEKVDAFSRYGKTSVVVLNTAKESPSRSFFDTAHEAAHGILHYGQPPKPHDQKEDEAQRFAGAFLMPKRAFMRDYWSKGRIDWYNTLEMKHRWGTSIAAILVRAYHLNCISAAVYRTAWRDLSARGWRTDEPDEPEPQFPKLFDLAIQQYEKRTQRNGAELANALFMTTDLFGKITGTTPRKATSPGVVSLAERRQQKSPTS